ncbi:MAG: hypothetical protein EB160_08490 [Nitrososphaeria archaeon]|nr:hypothetical protein [Nitrososphaeria archaeon]
MISAIVLMSLLFGVPIAFAETDPILITKSAGLDKIVFDGKWTTSLEWKPTSWNELKYNQTMIHLRTAHQGDFIYVMIDAVDDVTISNDDRTVVCFDGKNNKGILADYDDYCFVASPNSDAVTYQGTMNTEQFKIIPNPDGFIGIGAQSDRNDRYSPISHVGYEFRIPIELFGRSDNYGFFVSVYDSDVQKFYSWPDQLNQDFHKISPSNWGNIVSPDKTMPEFSLPTIILLVSLGGIVFFYKK